MCEHFVFSILPMLWTGFKKNLDEQATSGLTCRRSTNINPEVAGSNPALVNLYLFIQNLSKNVPSQFLLWFIT